MIKVTPSKKIGLFKIVSNVRLMLGIMMTTMFLSMWISNTETTAMMVTIVNAVLDEFDKDSCNAYKTSTSIETTLANSGSNTSIVHVDDISIDSSSFDIGQNGKYWDLKFATWMVYSIPSMIVNVIIAWIYLVIVFLDPYTGLFLESQKNKSTNAVDISDESEINVGKLLKDKLKALGPMSFHELSVATLFIFVVALRLFRERKFMKGWADTFPTMDAIGDSSVVILVVFLLFVVPKNIDFLTTGNGKIQALLHWKFVQNLLQWGVILLMGGGFAMTDASDSSGLSNWIDDQLIGVECLPHAVIRIIVMILTATVIKVASNTDCANVIISILISLSRRLNIHPIYLTLPAIMTCSYACMLPVATEIGF